MHIRLLYKKVLCVFLSLMIVIGSTQSAFANTSVGGWTLTDSLIAGANTTINATKTAGGIALESSVKVGASVAKTGVKLIKGGGSVALALAVTQIAGDSVDWVLDPANNAVKYKIDAIDDGNDAKTNLGKYQSIVDGNFYFNKDTVCSMGKQYNNLSSSFTCFVFSDNVIYIHNPSNSNPTSNVGIAGFYQPNRLEAPPDSADNWEYIPIETVAAQVISNAEAGHGPSQDVVEAVALEGFAAGELDPALNASANVAGAAAAAAEAADTTNPPDTADPANPANPAFDDSAILSALYSIKAVAVGILGSFSDFTDWYKTQWATFTGSFTEIKDWAMADPEPLADEPVLIGDDSESLTGWQEKANAGYVNFDGQCPNDVEIPITFMGSSSVVSLSYIPFCHFASLIKYAVIMGAWIGALMIISVGRSKE